MMQVEPHPAPLEGTVHRAKQEPKMTTGRACLVGLMEQYLAGMLEPFISLLEVHKLMCFMQEAGEPLRLRMSKGPYGPYAENLRHVLIAIDGYFIRGYGAGEDSPRKRLELVQTSVGRGRALLKERPETEARFKRVGRLVEGFESPFGLELIATVHWVAAHEGAESEKSVIEQAYAWGERKKRFSRDQLRLARNVMRDQGWLN
jgi:hypothetical protein